VCGAWCVHRIYPLLVRYAKKQRYCFKIQIKLIKFYFPFLLVYHLQHFHLLGSWLRCPLGIAGYMPAGGAYITAVGYCIPYVKSAISCNIALVTCISPLIFRIALG